MGKVTFGFAVFFGLASGSIHAGIYTISAGGLNGCGGSFGGGFGPASSPSLISDQFSGPCEFGTQSYSAIAGPGLLGASVANTFFGAGNASLGSASAKFTGLVTIVDPVTETVGISMNIFLDGALDTGGLGGGSAGIDLFTSFGSGHWNLTLGSSGDFLIPVPNSSGVVVTPTINVQTNTPFTFEMQLDLAAGAQFNGFINLDYAHTVSFPASGPAFNVPLGLTVQSSDLNIVNNQWVDPRAAVTTPEPGSFGLVIGGMLVGWAYRRSRSRRCD